MHAVSSVHDALQRTRWRSRRDTVLDEDAVIPTELRIDQRSQHVLSTDIASSRQMRTWTESAEERPDAFRVAGLDTAHPAHAELRVVLA